MEALFISLEGSQMPRQVLTAIKADPAAGNITFHSCKRDDFWKMLRSSRTLHFIVVDDSVAQNKIMRSIKRTLRIFYAGVVIKPSVIIFSEKNHVRFPRYKGWLHAKNEKELAYHLTP